MAIRGKIEQITSNTRKQNAFLNLESNDSSVECWSNHHYSPTYMWITEETWGIIVFETLEDEKEWLQESKYLSLLPQKVFKMTNGDIELIYKE